MNFQCLCKCGIVYVQISVKLEDNSSVDYVIVIFSTISKRYNVRGSQTTFLCSARFDVR